MLFAWLGYNSFDRLWLKLVRNLARSRSYRVSRLSFIRFIWLHGIESQIDSGVCLLVLFRKFFTLDQLFGGQLTEFSWT